MARQVRDPGEITAVNSDFEVFRLPIASSLDQGAFGFYGTTDTSVALSMANVRWINNTRKFRGLYSESSGDNTPYSIGDVVIGNNMQIYRLASGTGDTDPGTSATGWEPIGGIMVEDDAANGNSTSIINFGGGLSVDASTAGTALVTTDDLTLAASAITDGARVTLGQHGTDQTVDVLGGTGITVARDTMGRILITNDISDILGASAFSMTATYTDNNLVYRGGTTSPGDLFVYVGGSPVTGANAPLPAVGVMANDSWRQVGGSGLQVNGTQGINELTFGNGLETTTDSTNNLGRTVELDLAINTTENAGNAATLVTTGTADEQGLYVPVQQWARTADTTGANMIPLAKLPNLQLGNTHTYNSRADLIANQGEISRGTQAAPQLAWHTGDLAVVTSQDSANAGIYVYIGANQVDENDNPVPAGFVNEAGFNMNFRAVVSSDGQIQTTFSRSADGTSTPMIAPTQLSNINYNPAMDRVEFTAGSQTVNVNQIEPVAGTVTANRLYRRLKVGNDVFVMGDPSPTPTLAFASSPFVSRYHSGTQTASVGFRPSAGTASNFDTPMIDGAGNSAVITGNNLVATIAARQGSTPSAWRITAEGDITIINQGISEGPFENITATGSIQLRDVRVQPTISNNNVTRSALLGGPVTHTIDFTGSGNIADGTAYDSNTYALSGPGVRGGTSTFTTPASISDSTTTVSFSTSGSRMNNQTGNPANQTVRVNRFTPWFIGTAAAAPMSNQELIAATGIRQQGNNISNQTNFPVSGTVGEDVYVIAAGLNSIVLTVTVNNQPTSASTPGLPITTFTIPAAVGTITYTVYQFAGLANDPTTFNITVT